MRYQVVALEDKTNPIVAVGVPVFVGVVRGVDAVDDEGPRIVVIKAADDVQESCFSRPRRTQDCHELIVAERDGHVVQRNLGEVRNRIGLADVV